MSTAKFLKLKGELCVLLLFYLSSQLFASSPNRCDIKQRITRLTTCQECSINALLRCPFPYTQTSGPIGSSGVRGCPLQIHFGSVIGIITVQGCHHTCARMVSYRQCCQGFYGWGCQACPGNPVCSSVGKCFDKILGNGTCACQDGFQGTACEFCTNSTMFGPGCNQTCSCKRGICDNSVNSTGQCKQYSCHIGYIGANCDKRLPACDQGAHVLCAKNADCFKVKGLDTCVCEPGYTGNGNTSCLAINPCNDSSSHGCHSDAACLYLGPGKHKCQCKQGYQGDGRFCLVVNPCTSGNGGCNKNSSICNFLGPGKSNCSCLEGFYNFTSSKGCSLIDMCNDGNRGGCDINANCVMPKPGEKRCICKKGFRGNGTVCYGNILERMQQLTATGPPGIKGRLSQAVTIFHSVFSRPLADTGPFTAFVFTDDAIRSLTDNQRAQLSSQTDLASHIVRLHIVAADLASSTLIKLQKVTTLQGMDATISETNGSLYYSLVGSSQNAKIIASDFVAGNGIVHIIDTIFWRPAINYSYTTNSSLLHIIETSKEFSQFASFLQLTGLDSYISGSEGQWTFLVPDNNAFKFDQMTTDYLTKTNKGKDKLRQILKNHIFSSKFHITDLMSMSRLKSIQGESNTINRKDNGAILIGGKAQITGSNILGKDGIIHKISAVLVPDFVLPLVPNFANKTTYSSAAGVCYRCDTMPSFPNKGCPSGFKPSGGFVSCRYRLLTLFGYFSFYGCRIRYCRKAKQIPECNSGYYGSNCRPCPGGLGEKPCNLHGKCDDSIKGSGLCNCYPLFAGTACEKCQNATMFGPDCNRTCTCIHGLCDSGVYGNGTCKPNTCQTGYHGNNCDITDKSCVGSSSLRCHFKARCVNDDGQDMCKCIAGYEGSGLECYEINPCSKPNRGGCHKDAKCTKTGPGTNVCTCDKGFTGDGIICIAVNPCKDGTHPSCHSNAECKFLGPGQSTCQCKSGFTGDGSSCVEINNCLINNGGCSKKAKCSRVGPGKSSCACFHGYIGNGYFCLGSVAMVLQDDRRFTSFFNLIKKAHMQYYLSVDSMNFTIFAPSSKAVAALSKNDSDYWTSSPVRLKFLLQNHITNTTLFKHNLKNNSVLVAVNGQELVVTITHHMVMLNGKANVTTFDIVGANGVIHVLDQVLVPSRLPETKLPTAIQVLSQVPEFSNFYNLLKQKGVLADVDNHVGITIFVPVNDVLSANKSLTSKALKFHVVTKYISPGHFFNGQEFQTLVKNVNFKVKLTKPSAGKTEVNGILFYNSPILAKSSIIYKLSGILTVPPQRHCDQTRVIHGVTLCRLCFFQNNCPSGWQKVGTQLCRYWFALPGCQAVCRKTTVTKKCCSGFWGKDCQACPGNITTACSGNGICLDGISGSGHCQCKSNFTGTSCEKCLPNQYGESCSSKCDCVHGRCNEGPTGDGFCSCRHGWHGPRCSRRADPEMCQPTVCNPNATCRNISQSFKCDCDVGFTGNGTFCRAIHVCDTENGGCHKHALCNPYPTDPSLATCSCKKGYSGDGQYCSAIDLCQTENGGCHQNATCANIGPAVRNCFCNDGFHGDGVNCVPDDPCKVNNGGCSLRATCKRTGPGQRTCTCDAKYYGDGERCIGNSMELLRKDPELTKINELFKKYRIDKLLESNCRANVLAPDNRALSKILNNKRRKKRSAPIAPTVEQYLRYHIIGCVRFTKNTFKTGGHFISLLGAPIWLEISGRNKSRVVFRDSKGNSANVTETVESENGFVFKLDAVLTPLPYYLRFGDQSKSVIKVANELGYTTSAKLLKKAGLDNIISNRYGQPYLVFLTHNKGISSALEANLTDPANVGELTEYMKYHVVHNAPENLSTEFFVRSGGGVQFRTMQGQSIFISCQGGKGDLYVNGLSRIMRRDIKFNGGIAFVVDKIVTPLGLGGKCDEIVHQKTMGPCGSCLSAEGCPHDSTLVGTTNHNCSYDSGLIGCQHICMKRKVVNKCCPNFYGSDCRVCPGGRGMACSRRGQCDDGLAGTGRCRCNHGFYGTACERCTATCQVTSPCLDNNGGCHVFASCSNATGHVQCTCKSGYEGDGFYCQMKDMCTTDNGGCGINATCHFQGPGQRRCLCKKGFYKTIGGCKAFVSSSPCAVNHGGCSDHASCRNNNGTALCTCWDSYVGNGYFCHGNIIQTLQNTVKVQSFFKALYHLRDSNQGQPLFSSLQSDSKYFTVFAPINSAMRIQDFNLTLIKNHITSARVVLLTINTMYTATSLLGTKIMMRKLNSGILTINGVAHVLEKIKTTNGFIYIVDQAIPIIREVPPTPTTPPSSAPPSSTPPSSAPPPSTPPWSAPPWSASPLPPSLIPISLPTAPPASLTSSSSPKSTFSRQPPTTTGKFHTIPFLPTIEHTTSSSPKTQSTSKTTTKSRKLPSSFPATPLITSNHSETTEWTNFTAKPGVLGGHRTSKGVNAEVVVGIVIAVIALIIIIASAIWFLRKRALLPSKAFRYRKEDDTIQYDSDAFQENPPSLSYNNPMYDVSEPGPDSIQVHGDKSLPPPFKEETDFANPEYELEERPFGESTDDAGAMPFKEETDFANPIYELEERPFGESTDDAGAMKLSFHDTEIPPGEELC